MRRLSRINIWVPVRTKSRIAMVARRSGLKPSDVIRIGLGIALDHFERAPLQLPTSAKSTGPQATCDTS